MPSWAYFDSLKIGGQRGRKADPEEKILGFLREMLARPPAMIGAEHVVIVIEAMGLRQSN